MGIGDPAAKAQKITVNLRAEVSGQLQEAVEAGRKISEMAEVVSVRLFGSQPQPEREQPMPLVSPEAPVESILIDGIRAIRSAQAETAKTLQDILNRL